MKTLWLASGLSLVLVTAAPAASVTVSDTSTTMPGVAATQTAMLLDAGLKPKKLAGGKYVVEANGVHCDTRSNGPLDASQPQAGLPNVKCRINSKNQMNSNAGQPLAEARTQTDLFDKVQNNNDGIQLTDCAMGGYCGSFAKSIKCTINTMIENFENGGRWECEYTDGQ